MTSTRCPFCNIAAKYPPISPLSFNSNPDDAITTTPDPLLSRLRAETAETGSGQGSGSGLEPELESESSRAYLILSTESVLAFLDIMPLTRGHVLVTTREHCGTVGDVGVTTGREVCILVFHIIFVLRTRITDEGVQLGKWIPIISRAVMKTLFGDAEAHWNVVQNNGTSTPTIYSITINANISHRHKSCSSNPPRPLPHRPQATTGPAS